MGRDGYEPGDSMQSKPEYSHRHKKAGAAIAAAMVALLTLLAVAASVAIYPEAIGTVTLSKRRRRAGRKQCRPGLHNGKNVQQQKAQSTHYGRNQYTYDLDGDGEYDVYPLQDGNREYTVVVYQQVKGNSYSQVLSRTIRAEMSDENAAVPLAKPL